jgi:hypothetical protein
MRFDESELIGACALRFDGYAYSRETGFDATRADAALAHFFETGEWDTAPLELLATFFLLQRRYRWQYISGGDENEVSTEGWRAYRTLFLELCDYPIAERYRTKSYYRQWEDLFKPTLPAFKELVRAAMETEG